jgi:hypothetical protein
MFRTRSSKPPKATSTPVPDGSLPAKSIDSADAAFKNFSLSKFPNGAKSASYVDSTDDPAVVQSAQRRIITQQLNRLNTVGSPGRGISLALPKSVVEALLPSLKEEASTIELSDVLKVIVQHMRGTELYANGNPVLNRLALRSRARELVAAIARQSAAEPHEAETAPDPQGTRT